MEIKHLSFAYEKAVPILRNVSFTIRRGAITTLMGANGCGKTTLLRLMSKGLHADSGEILLESRNIRQYGLKEFAREVAVVHQKNAAPDDLTVRSLVAYGRIPYTSAFRAPSAADDARVQWALHATGLAALSDRTLGTLSGGQRQRAFIAMALAQDTKVLFLDEPTTFLDVRYQIEILRLIKSINRDFGITIVMVLHDINQALAYSDEIIGLKDGAIAVQGAPNQVINAQVIEEIYGIKLEMIKNEGKICVLAV